MVLFGTILKLFFTGRFETFSTLLYLFMGWLILVDIRDLMQAVDIAALYWLFGGGLAYTLGIIFYRFDRLPYNHVIWHVFVLAGAVCHFFMIFLYII